MSRVLLLLVAVAGAADADGLRRALRDARAVGDAAVTVKRGADTRTVRVALPDDRPAEPPVPVGGK